MRKTLLALLLLASVSLLSAVDLDGKIGMGIGWSPQSTNVGGLIVLPITDIAVTRVGLGPKLAVEPIFQFTFDSGDSLDYLLFKLAALGDFLMKGHTKTNLYAKAGLGIAMEKYGSADMEFAFQLPFGFGLEHYVSDHFSINLAALSGLSFSSAGSQIEVKLGNDKPFAFYLMWYY
jgi:hypothetical protein